MLSIWMLLVPTGSALAQTAPPQTTPAQASAAATAAAQAQAPPKRSTPGTGGMRDALAKQRQAVRRQAELLGNWMLPFDTPRYVDTPCEPIEAAVVAPIIEGAAQSQKIDAKLLRAVIDRESGFHTCAVSSRGAQGLMQLMPETASQFSVSNALDPRENIEAGSKYLKQLLDRYNGDLPQALAAYNAGPARVDWAGGIPDIPETRDYVDSILAKLRSKDPDPPKDPDRPKNLPKDPKTKPAGVPP